MRYIVSAVEEMISTGVLWLRSSVRSIDPIKFNQTRQLACSSSVEVYYTSDYKIFFFF